MQSPEARPASSGASSGDIVDRVLAENRSQREREREELARAKAAAPADKEPFAIDRFASFYDLTNDRGELHLSPERIERYEYEYYVRRPEMRSIEEFAALRTELDSNSAG